MSMHPNENIRYITTLVDVRVVQFIRLITYSVLNEATGKTYKLIAFNEDEF